MRVPPLLSDSIPLIRPDHKRFSGSKVIPSKRCRDHGRFEALAWQARSWGIAERQSPGTYRLQRLDDGLAADLRRTHSTRSFIDMSAAPWIVQTIV